MASTDTTSSNTTNNSEIMRNAVRDNFPELLNIAERENRINSFGRLAGGTLCGIGYLMRLHLEGQTYDSWKELGLLGSVFFGLSFPALAIPFGISVISFFGYKLYRG